MFQNVLDPRSRPRLNEAAAWWAVGLVGAQIAALGAVWGEPQRQDPQLAVRPIDAEHALFCVELARAAPAQIAP